MVASQSETSKVQHRACTIENQVAPHRTQHLVPCYVEIAVILNGSVRLSASAPGVAGLLLVMLRPNRLAAPPASLKLLRLLAVLLLLADARLEALLLMLALRALCAMPRGAGSGCICGSGTPPQLSLRERTGDEL